MSVIKPALQYPELIAYFAGANNYSWLHFRNGEKKLLAKPISYLEDKLPDFIRVHKTVLVNPSYIKSLQQPPRKKMSGQVHLAGGEIFPVSRRRWKQVVASLQNHTDTPDGTGDPVAENQDLAQPQTLTNRAIFLITDDQVKAELTEQIVRKKWPAYQLYMAKQSAFLPELLAQLPEKEQPILLFLDARTAMQERLFTLQRLKEDNRFSRIPVILLVLPTDQQVINGYQQQANSVVSMPIESVLFEQTIERICQFWLQVATLPGGGN